MPDSDRTAGLGLSSYAYRWSIGAKGYRPTRPLRPREVLEAAAGHGYRGVQLCDHLELPAPASAEANELRETARRLGLFLELGARSIDPGYLRSMLALAATLEVRLLRAVPEVDRRSSAESVPDQLERLAAGLRTVAPLLADSGVRLALENHAGLRAAELRHLVERVGSEWVGVCLDTMNSIVLLERPAETVEMLAPLAFCVHLKDFTVVADPRFHRIVGTAIGEGMVPFGNLLKELRSKAPDPTYHVELYLDRLEAEPDTRALEECCVGKSLRYARDFLGFA